MSASALAASHHYRLSRPGDPSHRFPALVPCPLCTALRRDLLPDTVTLMAHSKPYVRKKAVLAMYKLFVAYPQGLRLTFDKLKEKLADAEAAG